MAASGARYLEASDRVLTLGDVILTVLPPPLRSDDQNGNSVGLLLSYGGFEAILPGDATAEEQDWWQDHYRDLLDDVDVYKAAHHGSSTGDRSGFVRLLDPEVVVVSAGLDNSYGHPHREAVDSYSGVGARLYRTDRDASVTILVPAGGHTGYRVATGAVQPAGASGVLGVLEALLTELETLLK